MSAESVGGQGLSVWATAQRTARKQRDGRYLTGAARHPARMLPDVAAYAITHLTRPGELVLDPMCGTGTTLVEALHHGRAAVGIDIEPEWTSIARQAIAHTHRTGVGGYAHVITADARSLPRALPPEYLDQMLGQVRLLLTSWPHSTHPHTHPDARPGNLDHHPRPRQLAGMTHILRGALPLLAPDAYVVITARPWREHGELVDLPDAITRAGLAAGLTPIQHCVALLAGIRDGQVITRATHFQRVMVARARDHGLPWHLGCTEHVTVLRPAPAGVRRARRTANRVARRGHARTTPQTQPAARTSRKDT